MKKNHKGQRLKAARKAAGLSQKQLGERLGVDQAFLSRVENGANEGTVSFWCDAAEALGTTLDALLREGASRPPRQRIDAPEYLDRMTILAHYDFPKGLRALAQDNALVDSLSIDNDEWAQLASIPLPSEVGKDGYMLLLLTLRSIGRTINAVADRGHEADSG